MKGLLVCIAVGCLAIASAAPAEESNKQITKHFKFGDAGDDVIMLPPISNTFSKEEIVVGLCKGKGADQKCSIHLDKTDSYDKLNTSCYIPSLKFSGRAVHNVVLTNAGNSRAVIALDDQTKIKLISVNLKSCEIHETSVDLPKDFKKEPDAFLGVVVVAHDKNYDVFYQNQEHCRDYYCQATYDYEGKVVKAAAPFPVKFVGNSYIKMEYANNAFLVHQLNFGSPDVGTLVYLVKDGEFTAQILYRDDDYPKSFSTSINTEEDKFGLCVPSDGRVLCKQYDVDGRTKITEFDFRNDYSNSFLAVQNAEKGLIVAVQFFNVTRNGQYMPNTFISSFDDQGKQQKYVKIDLEPRLRKPRFVHPTLYKNSNGQYCAVFMQLCYSEMPESPCSDQPISEVGEFFTSTRCFSKTELF